MTQLDSSDPAPRPKDAADLTTFGYKQTLERTMGPFASFAVAFSMVSIVTSIFFLFPTLFATTGGVGIWLWVPVFLGIFPIVLVYAHLGARIPLTGYAYQWNSRLISRHFGWFSGWTAMLAFFGGTASIGTALSSVFSHVIWENPTTGQRVLFAGISVAVAGTLNIVSIKATALVNNIGVSFEMAASIVASIILVIGVAFFFPDSAGLAILGHINEAEGQTLSVSAILAAAVLPLYTFLGWEGAADLAEETRDPRRVTPKAMIRANTLSLATSFFMIVAFAVAIPHGVADMLAQTDNPLIYIFSEQFGPIAGRVLEVLVFVAIFSCLLANMAVATRMCYSMARDHMLPGSRGLAVVARRTQTPVVAVMLVCIVAFGINLLSEGLAANIASIVTVSYYATYGLTMLAVLLAYKRRTIPAGVAGGFDLGRWLVPLAVFGFVWATAVCVYGLFGQESFVAFEYFFGAQIVGLVWYLVWLRRRINNGQAGAASEPVVDDVADQASSVLDSPVPQGDPA